LTAWRWKRLEAVAAGGTAALLPLSSDAAESRITCPWHC
jgi:hypothetical protein